jgi:hypothetical protein
MTDLVTKIVDCVRVRDQTVIACYRLSHELTLGPSPPPSQGQQVVAPRESNSSTRRKKSLSPKVLPTPPFEGIEFVIRDP